MGPRPRPVSAARSPNWRRKLIEKYEPAAKVLDCGSPPVQQATPREIELPGRPTRPRFDCSRSFVRFRQKERNSLPASKLRQK
jgi:hypothetical protein